jgi:hypothetical protein
MDNIPCFLCGTELTVSTDKNGKLYMICDPCGSQHFIRRKPGMERLAQLGRYCYWQKASLAARMKTLLRLQAHLHEIDTLKGEIRRLGFEAGIFFQDEEKLRARDALQKRVEFLLAELERESENSD